MQWLNILLTVVFYIWLFAVLALLWGVWRSGVKRTQELEQSLINSTRVSATAAKEAAEAARLLIERITQDAHHPN